MLAMIARRLRDLLFILLLMPLLTVAMLEAAPGRYCDYILPETASAETRQACYDREPGLLEKYLRALRNLLRLNLGQSLRSGRPVADELAWNFPATCELALISLALSLAGGVAAGVVAVKGRYRLWGHWLNWSGVSLLALPSFVLAVLLRDVFVARFQMTTVIGSPYNLKQLLLPALTIAIPLGAFFMRVTRNALLETLDKDYIRTARAAGLSDWRILVRHALPNTAATLVPLTGLILASLLDGTLLVERVFGRAGLGSYVFNALTSKDYPVVQGVVLLVAVLTALISLGADLLQAALTPASRAELLSR